MSGTRMATLAGVSTGLAACVALVALGVVTRPATRDPALDMDRRAEFVVDYRRSRTTTYRMLSSFTREMKAGGVLTSEREVVQRPPDRILRQFGGVDGVVNGHLVVCTSPPDGSYSCTEGAAATKSFDEEVASEVRALEGYFAGPLPLYRATRAADGCYELRQQNPYPDPPYGGYARFCFDGETGALRRMERHIALATETVEALYITTDVRDADFDLAADPEFAAKASRGSSPPTTEAPFDPCEPGERLALGNCPEERVFAACANPDERARAVAELRRRQVSVNDARLTDPECVAAYAREVLTHAPTPPATIAPVPPP